MDGDIKGMCIPVCQLLTLIPQLHEPLLCDGGVIGKDYHNWQALERQAVLSLQVGQQCLLQAVSDELQRGQGIVHAEAACNKHTTKTRYTCIAVNGVDRE